MNSAGAPTATNSPPTISTTTAATDHRHCQVDPIQAKALEKILILYLDHEQNASTSVRHAALLLALLCHMLLALLFHMLLAARSAA